MNLDDGTLTNAQRNALRQFVSVAPPPGARGRGRRSTARAAADPPPQGRIVLDVRGREIGINGDDRGALNVAVDDDFRTRLARDLLYFLDPVGFLDGSTTTGIWRQPDDYRLTLTWDVALQQRNVTDEDFEVLLDMARSSNRSRVVFEVWRVVDECAAQRAVRLLAAFADLEHLEVSDRKPSEFDHRSYLTTGDLPDECLAERLHMLLKALLAHRNASPTFACKLSTLDYRCECFVSPSLLLEFFESIANNLKKLQFGSEYFELNDEDLARSCARVFARLPRLQTLKFCPALSLHLPYVVESLVVASDLQELEVTLSALMDSFDVLDKLMANYLPSVARLAARSRKLRHLNLSSIIDEELGYTRYNATPVLLRAAESSSLETLEFGCFSIGGPVPMIRLDGPSNETVSSVIFEGCELRAGTFELLSKFKGITSIRLIGGCTGLELTGQWQSLFANHPKLKSFEINTEEFEDEPEVTHDSIMDGIAQAGHSFDRLQLHQTNDGLPLKKLLVETGGSVELRLYGVESNSFLAAGIEGAKKLECLRLGLCGSPPEVLAQVLKAVQVNKSLRSFAFDFSFQFGQPEGYTNECADRLMDLLRLNPRLKALALTDEGLSRFLLPTLVEGLRVNRSLEVLEVKAWDSKLFSDSTLIDNFTNVLEVHNTSLKTIKGLDLETKDVRERFERYAWQNRSGRHFVRNVDQVTPSLFPCILFAISKDTGADGIRYFLKNLSTERLLRILSPRGMTRSRPSEVE